MGQYKALEAILNTSNREGLDISKEGASPEGQKSIVSVDKPITVVEEQHHSDSTVDGAAIRFFKNSQATGAVCLPSSKSSQ